jgi:uncharacterized 2Fe-2S/4Fe-4S cluster protein (DUF4445 family)
MRATLQAGVKLVINSREVEAPAGRSLFELAERAGIRVPTSCHGQGKCRECLVEVVEGMELLSDRTPEERELRGDFRLACRCRAAAASGRVRCHTLRRGALRIEERSAALPVHGAPPPLDPAVTRQGDRVLLDGVEITRPEGPTRSSGPTRSGGPIHGLAMDLGTTTVVLRLFDLETGTLRATSSFENPQRFGGSNVMARIEYDTTHPGRLLQRTLLGYLGRAIDELPVEPETIYELVVAGNSTMRDLFFGLDVHPIGQKPYRSITQRDVIAGRRDSTSLALPARRLRLPLHPRARVYGLPLISGHVGADAAACLLAVDLAREERLVGLMDLGTNTELVVGNRRRILAASCPAGPAFEGGAIACGMPSLDGAIESVRIGQDGGVDVRVIGDAAPEGLCGSGLVELLSELLRTGRMNVRGRLPAGSDRFVVDAERAISLRERDISELAQAKAANAAGLRLVLESYGASLDDVEVFYLAGAFGRHLNLDAARRIGLIPDLPDRKIVQVGNAAIEGASIALLSQTRRRELEALVGTVTHVELQSHPEFFDAFVEGCLFGP